MRQRTLDINGIKLLVKSNAATYMGNLRGWYVWINGKRYFSNLLKRSEAVEAVIKRHFKNEEKRNETSHA